MQFLLGRQCRMIQLPIRQFGNESFARTKRLPWKCKGKYKYYSIPFNLNFGINPFDFENCRFSFWKCPFSYGICPFSYGICPFSYGKCPFSFGKSNFIIGKSKLNFGKSNLNIGKSKPNFENICSIEIEFEMVYNIS